MGRLQFLIALTIAVVSSAAVLSQEEDVADSPERQMAERVIRLGGQIEIQAGNGKARRVQKVSELPEGPFTLTRLDLGGQSRATDADLKNISGQSELAELNLGYTRITDEGLKSLENLPGLRKLYLSETQITDRALERIVQFENLISLDLSGTKITNQSLQELKKLPHLTRLFLGRTGITGEGVATLAELSNLTVLHIAGTELSAEDVAGLARLPKLEELSLTTGDDGLAKLANLPKLKILTVHGPGISDEGMPALAKLAGIEQLRLSQTGISERGVKMLKDSLKECRIMAHPISRQSAFLMSPGPAQRPVLRWQPGEAASDWPGLISRPAKLPGVARWQIETREPRSEIRSVEYSPNGTQIACGSADGFVRIYNADTLALERLIPAHPGGVFSVAWSPDGTRLASGGADALVRIWDSQGREQHEWKGHRSSVTTIAWSPDGTWLASGSWDTTVRLWKADGSTSQELKGHTKAVYSLAWSGDGKQLATGSTDTTIRIWDMMGKELHIMEGHTDAVTSLAWSSRGSRLASGSWDHTIRFWNAHTGRGGPVLEGHTYRVTGVEWHPQGSLLASVGDRTLRLWTLDGTPVRTVKTEEDQILSLSWKHDGKEIATGTRFNSVLRVSGVEEGSAERSTGEGLPGGATELAWHPSGDRIAAACRDRKIRLVTADGRPGAILGGYNVRTVDWSPDGERLASGGDHLLRLWNRQGVPLKALKEHTKGIHSLDWSPDGKSLATISEDGTARVWSAEGTIEQVIQVDPGTRRVAWGPDSRQFVTASNKVVKIWNRDGTPGPELSEPPASLVSLAWNRTTDKIAVGGWSRTLLLWNGEGEKGSSAKQDQAILDIAIEPNGGRLAMALFGNKAAIAEADGSQAKTWNAHAGALTSIAWHPKGLAVVSGAYDNTIRFWDAETREPQRTVLFFGDGTSATFTAAGQLEHGEVDSLEDRLVYIVEGEAGAPVLLSPSEFEARFRNAGEKTSAQQGG